MRHGELQRRRLIRLDEAVLPARRGGVDGEEGQTAGGVAGGLCARHDEGFGVLFVFDHAEVGGIVGVGELEGLEVRDVEETL